MMELLHATNVPLGLITNGEQWMLVHAPRGETTAFVSWYANLWFEEHITLRAFRSFLGAYRFFGVADEETLAAMLSQSVSIDPSQWTLILDLLYAPSFTSPPVNAPQPVHA